MMAELYKLRTGQGTGVAYSLLALRMDAEGVRRHARVRFFV